MLYISEYRMYIYNIIHMYIFAVTHTHGKKSWLGGHPPQPRFDECFTMVFHSYTKKLKMIPCSIRTFWYKGSTDNKGK